VTIIIIIIIIIIINSSIGGKSVSIVNIRILMVDLLVVTVVAELAEMNLIAFYIVM
jgi:hypothetical protein